MRSDDQLIRRRPGLLEAELDGEIVGLHVEQGTCYGFNPTATRVWQLLEQPLSRQQLREALLQEFEVDEETCGTQLDALIDDLEGNGLVEVASPG